MACEAIAYVVIVCGCLCAAVTFAAAGICCYLILHYFCCGCAEGNAAL
jgi:hypothetical protein